MRSNLETLQRSPPTKKRIKWQEAAARLSRNEVPKQGQKQAVLGWRMGVPPQHVSQLLALLPRTQQGSSSRLKAQRRDPRQRARVRFPKTQHILRVIMKLKWKFQLTKALNGWVLQTQHIGHLWIMESKSVRCCKKRKFDPKTYCYWGKRGAYRLLLEPIWS